MTAAFGAAVSNWDMRLSDAGGKTGYLVSAVDGALIEEIRALCRSKDLHLMSIQPNLALAFNRCRKALEKRTAWFAVHEDGQIVVSLFKTGNWASIASRRVGRSWETELFEVLDREQLVVETDGAECNEVLLYAPGLPYARDFGGDRYRVEQLGLDSPRTLGDREHAVAA
jgi:hypothetical protein